MQAKQKMESELATTPASVKRTAIKRRAMPTTAMILDTPSLFSSKKPFLSTSFVSSSFQALIALSKSFGFFFAKRRIDSRLTDSSPWATTPKSSCKVALSIGFSGSSISTSRIKVYDDVDDDVEDFPESSRSMRMYPI